jgi:hypothetical protein
MDVREAQDGVGTDTTLPQRRGRFQFGLRTLLLTVALIAVASWVYCVVWPWWNGNPDQARFLDPAQKIKAGMTRYESYRLVHDEYGCKRYDSGGLAERKLIFMTSYCWIDRIYCIYVVTGPVPRRHELLEPIYSVEIFRLSPAPPNYPWTPCVASFHSDVIRFRRSDVPLGNYLSDFAAFLSGDRRQNAGFQYELVYRDPPAQTPAR